MNEIKKFEERFSEETVDLLILTKSAVGGGSVVGEMLIPSIEFIASVNLNTDELSTEKGRLEWIIKNNPDRIGWGYDFEQFEICHIKARKNIPVKLESYMSKVMNNCYMVTELVEKNVAEPRLDEIKKRLSKPVVIEESELGKFELNREFSWFEGDIDWLGDKCYVYLETDEEDGDTAEKALFIFKELYKDLKNWDNKFRTYAANKLTELANEWLDDIIDDGEGVTERMQAFFSRFGLSKKITKKSFAKRITISELSIAPNGDLTLYYSDDDMFLGHTIEIDANICGEISDANIAG